MSNVTLLTSGRQSAAEKAYLSGQEAARAYYVADLGQRMTRAWINKETYLLASYPCQKEDPLYRLACLQDYRNGVVYVVNATFPNMHIFMMGPEKSCIIEIVVCRSRITEWGLRMVLWFCDTFLWPRKS